MPEPLTAHPSGLPRNDIAMHALRWSVVLIFFWFGGMKFAAYEAQGVAGLAQNYWAFGWLYPMLGVAGVSALIGTIEIVIGLLLAAGLWSGRAGALGGILGMVTFAITLSFMLSAPMVWQNGYGFPALGMTGQFLIKDLALFAACFLLAREGWRWARAERPSDA
jgi:uncharacterized membrane protein YkgB